MKKWVLLIGLMVVIQTTVKAQFKETIQLASLSPTLMVVTSDIKNYKKMHYTLSTIGYLGSYMITDSIWKSAAITMAFGITKELIHDSLLGKGEPLLDDMMWNTLGTAQGVVFTISLKF